MKRIIEICKSSTKNSHQMSQNEFLKIRLRGKGSRFLEDRVKRGLFEIDLCYNVLEADEPMHLCVSSKYMEVFIKACALIEELLEEVYREYEMVCKKAGKPLERELKIKRIEGGQTF